MKSVKWEMENGNSSISLQPSLTPVTIRRRVMACQPTFLSRAFPQAVFLFIVLSVCAATTHAQTGGGGSNNPNNPTHGAGVSHTIRGKLSRRSGKTADRR